MQHEASSSMLFLSLKFHLLLGAQWEQKSFFLYLVFLTLCKELDIIESLRSQEHVRSLGPVFWSQSKRMKLRLRRERRICPEWVGLLVTELGPEWWSSQHSTLQHLLCPTVCWALHYIQGHDNDDYKNFFSYTRLRSKWLGQTQKKKHTKKQKQQQQKL